MLRRRSSAARDLAPSRTSIGRRGRAAAGHRPTPGVARAGAQPWVEPDDGVCPASHPVKAKLASKIFHLPGMANYDRTNPDRCYLDAAEAEADGLRPAKR